MIEAKEDQYMNPTDIPILECFVNKDWTLFEGPVDPATAWLPSKHTA